VNALADNGALSNPAGLADSDARADIALRHDKAVFFDNHRIANVSKVIHPASITQNRILMDTSGDYDVVSYLNILADYETAGARKSNTVFIWSKSKTVCVFP
jgi:hypothetical protein